MENNVNSQRELFNRSKKLVPGGVHSPVRSFKGMESTPLFIKNASGAYLTDIEGRDYIDFCMSFGPLILGHKNKKVEKDLAKALTKGWSYGACTPYAYDLAEYILSNIHFLDQIRFVNSGTEAVMTALRLARGYTKKDKIIKFNGCYHGHTDSMLIKAGSGLAGTSTSSSDGVPQGHAQDTLIAELGDINQIKIYLSKYPNEIAAIIIEPLPANNGLLIQKNQFLKELRAITKEKNILLIFDEVISGFRVEFSGMASQSKIIPDIVTYGKIIGGGLPVGALASRREIMEQLSPVGNVYQAGTLSANPLAMVAGLSTLSQMTKEKYELLEFYTSKVVDIFKHWFLEYNNGLYSNYNIIHHSSLFWIVKGDKIRSVQEIPRDIEIHFVSLFETLLKKGIYLSPNAYEVGFIGLAHDEKVLNDLYKRLWS